MHLFDPGAKIQKDSFRYVVSKCIFPPRSERYIKIHLDTLRYMQIHRPHNIVRTEKNICQTFLWSLNSQIPGVKVIQTHCTWTSSPLMGTSGPRKKTHAGKGCFYKTMFKLDRIYPNITKKQKCLKKHRQQISRNNPKKSLTLKQLSNFELWNICLISKKKFLRNQEK